MNKKLIAITLTAFVTTGCNGYKNIYEHFPYEFRTSKYIIRGDGFHLFSNKIIDLSSLDNDSYLLVGYGNFSNNAYEYVTAQLYYSCKNDVGEIVSDKSFVTTDFFSNNYTVSELNVDFSYKEYYYSFEVYGTFDIPTSLLDTIKTISVRFSIFSEDLSLFDTPIESSTNITYIDGIITFEGFTPFTFIQ